MSKRDIGASVRQRLLNQAHEQGRPFQELLQYFVMERFLYRLSKSQFRDSFIPEGCSIADCLEGATVEADDGH